ncbi:MAG: DUF58 domain-containing protein [Oscillospiraceae bacterium]|nr:DUF58 domain-containing protein [Oscillospiraceae bacterium]
MRFVYILLLIGLAFFYALYTDTLSLITLIIAAAVPVVTFPLTAYAASKLKISAAVPESFAAKGNDTELLIQITNPTPIPLPVTAIWVECRRLPGNEKEQQRVIVAVPSKSTEKISINVRSDFCQRVECGIAKIRIYDFFRLFCIRSSKGGSIHAAVDFLPSGGYPLSDKYAYKLTVNETVSSQSDMSRISSAVQELDSLREYRDGDKLNRIAWKLSSRSEELIVRESSANNRALILLAADTASAKGDIGEADRICESFYTAAMTLCEHEILFDSYTSEGVFINDISLTDRLEGCIHGLYGADISAETIAVNPENRRYDIIYIVSSGIDDTLYDKIRKSYGARNVTVIVPIREQ